MGVLFPACEGTHGTGLVLETTATDKGGTDVPRISLTLRAAVSAWPCLHCLAQRKSGFGQQTLLKGLISNTANKVIAYGIVQCLFEVAELSQLPKFGHILGNTFLWQLVPTVELEPLKDFRWSRTEVALEQSENLFQGFLPRCVRRHQGTNNSKSRSTTDAQEGCTSLIIGRNRIRLHVEIKTLNIRVPCLRMADTKWLQVTNGSHHDQEKDHCQKFSQQLKRVHFLHLVANVLCMHANRGTNLYLKKETLIEANSGYCMILMKASACIYTNKASPPSWEVNWKLPLITALA